MGCNRSNGRSHRAHELVSAVADVVVGVAVVAAASAVGGCTEAGALVRHHARTHNRFISPAFAQQGVGTGPQAFQRPVHAVSAVGKTSTRLFSSSRRRRGEADRRPSWLDNEEDYQDFSYFNQNPYSYYDEEEEEYKDYEEDTRLNNNRQEGTRNKKRALYWEDEEDDRPEDFKTQKKPSYSRINQDEMDEEDTWEQEYLAYHAALREDSRLEWETSSTTTLGTAHVLLPPVSVDRPAGIIHFVGGAFFGSAPQLWYSRLLEDVVRHTQCAVVATSLPVRLLQPPLQHLELATLLRKQFQYAWREVLVDEYGVDALEGLPVAGMGHSLGARLLVVLATTRSNGDTQSRRRREWEPPNSYRAMILMGFTNHPASAGIPGIQQLGKQSRSLDEELGSQQKQERHQQRLKSERRRRSQRRSGDWYDEEEDDEDENWSLLVEDLQSLIRQQTTRLQRALTPPTDALEFYPTPGQLWTALAAYQRFASVPHTLVVQMDQDDMDQSSRLATLIEPSTEVYFARIRGTHLAPVAVSRDTQKVSLDESSSFWGEEDPWLSRVSSKLTNSFTKLVTGQQRNKLNEASFVQMRQAICSYIIEKVTKDRVSSSEQSDSPSRKSSPSSPGDNPKKPTKS